MLTGVIVAGWVTLGAAAQLQHVGNEPGSAGAVGPGAAPSDAGTSGGAPPGLSRADATPGTDEGTVGDSTSLITWAPMLGLPLSGWWLWRRRVLSSGALTAEGRRELPPAPWLLWLLAAVLVFISLIIGGSTAMAIAGISAPQSAGGVVDSRTHGVSTLGAYLFACATSLTLVIVLRRRFERGSELRWLGASWRDGVTGLGALAIALPFVQAANIACVLLYRLVTSRMPPEVAHETLRAMREAPGDPWVWVQLGAAVIAAPVVEEILYRVMLQTAILQVTGRPWWAIAGSSVVFGLSHAGAVEWYAMPTLAMLGVALGVAFERTRSLGVPIVMHVAFNAINVWLASVM